MLVRSHNMSSVKDPLPSIKDPLPKARPVFRSQSPSSVCLPLLDQSSHSACSAPMSQPPAYFRNTLANTHKLSLANILLPPLILPPVNSTDSSRGTSPGAKPDVLQAAAHIRQLQSRSNAGANKRPGIRLPGVSETLPDLARLLDPARPGCSPREMSESMPSSENAAPESQKPDVLNNSNHGAGNKVLQKSYSADGLFSNEFLPNVSKFLPSASHNSVVAASQSAAPAKSSPRVSQSPIQKPKAPRKRKKKQCPECLKMVSNLATHKSTHISKDSKPHVCDVCRRGFTRINDLSRHAKRHLKESYSHMDADSDSNGENGLKPSIFKCPFWDHDGTASSLPSPSPSSPAAAHGEDAKAGSHHHPSPDQKCHQTGLFSRGDTFKNHLKALHFRYPENTKKKDRPFVSGQCKKCNKSFTNVNEWLDSHVLTNECEEIVHHCG